MHLFISRPVAPHSPLSLFARQRGYALTALSLLAFEGLPFALPDDPWPEWLFFYSKRGVRFFFARLSDLRQALPSSLRLAAIGPATAHAIRTAGHTVDFIGTGQPDATARAFRQIARGQRVCFVRAEQSRQSVQQLVADALEVIDLVVYRNSIRKEVTPPPAQLLIFTSPLNAEAWYQQRPPRPDQLVIAIGPTTARKLHELGIEQVHVAPSPSEHVIVELLQQLT